MCVTKKSKELVNDAACEEEVVERKVHEDFSRIDKPFGLEQHVFNWLWLGTAHVFAFYYLYLDITGRARTSTILFELLFGYIAGMGITVGCHRYWTHKTFKANLPLQIILMTMQTMSNQYPIRKWSLDHRIHHKYTDTNADPHNSTRGFWFSHIGWLLLPKHPDLQKKLKTFDMPDLENDPIVRFQSRWYWTLTAIIHFIIPICIFRYFWGLSMIHCIAANYRRYLVSLHITWCVNSVAHIWGDKPYDKNITPAENSWVSFLAAGEGWHNYHHTFPWDYKAAELGWKINPSTMFIDFFAWLGWAYDLKTISQTMLKQRLHRTGNGSHNLQGIDETIFDKDDFDYSVPADVTELMKDCIHQPIWGWDDETIPEDLRNVTKTLRSKGNN
ncbi:unnamed protein product [Orchesella dallaii]|uniref:Fatty acid desaturase domain-containing protein n=1 Tax=Orchesella dallaii TaxID=48710 RepID=A0ABP1R872_9HEXA